MRSHLTEHTNIPDSALRFLEGLIRDERIEKLILFGSRAFGDHEDRSDIDIAVCGAMIDRLQWARIKDAAFHAKSLYWISLVHFDSNPTTLQRRILETGTVIYVNAKSN